MTMYVIGTRVVPLENACPRCEGCGKIASDDEGTPWTFWAGLPAGSDLAVRMGLVRPLPCPDCAGTGEKGGGNG